MHNNLAVVEHFRPNSIPSIRDIIAELRNSHNGERALVAALVERLERDHAATEAIARHVVHSVLAEEAWRERRRSNVPTREVRTRCYEERRTQAKAIAATV